MKRIALFLSTVCAALLLSFGANALQPPDVSVQSESVILYERSTNTVIFSQNADERRSPAGLNKVMTALLALEQCSPDETVTMSHDAVTLTNPNGGVFSLKEGEEFTVDDLLHLMLMTASNEAAYALAEHVAGTVDAFVEQMNAEAVALGAYQTVFKNPYGFDEDGQFSTASDELLILREALKYDTFVTATSVRNYQISATNLTEKSRYFYTDNHLISSYKVEQYVYKYADSSLSTYTSGAGYCLFGTATSSGSDLDLVCLVMGGGRNTKDEPISSYVDAKNLFEAAFEQYDILELCSVGEILSEVPVDLAKTTDHVSVGASHAFTAVFPAGATKDTVDFSIQTVERTDAPVHIGDELGTLIISYQGENYAQVPLVSLEDVERSGFLYFIDLISDFFKKTFIKVLIVLLLLAIIFYVYLTISTNLRRKKLRRQQRARRIRRSR